MLPPARASRWMSSLFWIIIVIFVNPTSSAPPFRWLPTHIRYQNVSLYWVSTLIPSQHYFMWSQSTSCTITHWIEEPSTCLLLCYSEYSHAACTIMITLQGVSSLSSCSIPSMQSSLFFLNSLSLPNFRTMKPKQLIAQKHDHIGRHSQGGRRYHAIVAIPPLVACHSMLPSMVLHDGVRFL